MCPAKHCSIWIRFAHVCTRLVLIFSFGPNHWTSVTTVCVCVYASVNYSEYKHACPMSMLEVMLGVFFLWLTRWFHPTAMKRLQRKSVIPRWQNDWSKSNNACPEPTADETWDGKPCVKEAGDICCSLSSLVHWMQTDGFNCARRYLECHSEDQHSKDQCPKGPVTKHLLKRVDKQVLAILPPF